MRMRTGERGASAVEFAIVLPILLLVLFGIVNFGVVFAQKQSLTNAARQAARFGAVGERTCSEIESELTTTIDNEVFAKNTTTLNSRSVTKRPSGTSCGGATKPCAGSAVGDSVRVDVSYTSEFLMPWIVPGIPDTVTITGRGEFRCEYS